MYQDNLLIRTPYWHTYMHTHTHDERERERCITHTNTHTIPFPTRPSVCQSAVPSLKFRNLVTIVTLEIDHCPNMCTPPGTPLLTLTLTHARTHARTHAHTHTHTHTHTPCIPRDALNSRVLQKFLHSVVVAMEMEWKPLPLQSTKVQLH